mgnify:FL=1
MHLSKISNSEFGATIHEEEEEDQGIPTLAESKMLSKEHALAKNQQQLRKSPQKIYREQYPDGSVYEGEVLNGAKHGTGRFWYVGGAHYEGQYHHGNMEGFGRLYYDENTLAYEGTWVADKFHGKGTVYNNNPSPCDEEFDYMNFDNIGNFWVKYDGEFRDDLKHGTGVLYLSNGDKFVGVFVDDLAHGVCKTFLAMGSLFQENGQRISSSAFYKPLSFFCKCII